MDLVSKRIKETINSTLSQLIMPSGKSFYILEDGFRAVKVNGETRIPAGTYEIKLVEQGRHYKKYSSKWSWHKGAVLIDKVKGFKGIMLHIGNTINDTEGCLLIGLDYTTDNYNDYALLNSTDAYKSFYLELIKVIAKEQVFLTIKDIENE